MLPEEESEYHSGILSQEHRDADAKRLGRVYARLLSRGTSSGVGSRSLKGKNDATFNTLKAG